MAILPWARVSVPPIVAFEPKETIPEPPIFVVRLFITWAPVVNTRVPALPVPLKVMFERTLPLIAPEPVGVIAPPMVRF